MCHRRARASVRGQRDAEAKAANLIPSSKSSRVPILGTNSNPSWAQTQTHLWAGKSHATASSGTVPAGTTGSRHHQTRQNSFLSVWISIGAACAVRLGGSHGHGLFAGEAEFRSVRHHPVQHHADPPAKARPSQTSCRAAFASRSAQDFSQLCLPFSMDCAAI